MFSTNNLGCKFSYYGLCLQAMANRLCLYYFLFQSLYISSILVTIKKIGGSAEMEEKKVTWLELFYDLLFVAAVAAATHVLLHVEDGHIHVEY